MIPIPRATRCAAPTNDNVVTLPGRAAGGGARPVEPAEPAERWKGIAEPGSAVAAGLDAVAREDKASTSSTSWPARARPTR